MKLSNKVLVIALVMVFVSNLFGTNTALAATTPPMGLTATYGVVSSTFTNSNTAPQTIINGDVCYTTPPATAPLVITGATVTPCPPGVGTDQGSALVNLNGQACTSLGVGAVSLNAVIIGANPPGTFPPGCYSSGGAMNIVVGTTVTLNGAGTYIFRPDGGLTTGDNSLVTLANGASACDVFWTPTGATSLGANASLSVTPTFVGNIIDNAGITLGHFANLAGRALSFGGTVTTDANTISVPTCGAPSTINVTKVVINDSGRNNVVSDFPLFVNGVLVVSGDTNGFPSGSYTVTETSNPNYVATFSGSCDVNGTINLTPGANLSCVITNNDIPIPSSGGGGGGGGGSRVISSAAVVVQTPSLATLRIIKQVVNDNGGRAVASDFNIHVETSGVDVLGSPEVGTVAPGIFYTLSPDSYTVREDAGTLYSHSFSGDCDSNGVVSLEADDDKTCTITNDDIAGAVSTTPTLPYTGYSDNGPLFIIMVVVILIALFSLFLARRKNISSIINK